MHGLHIPVIYIVLAWLPTALVVTSHAIKLCNVVYILVLELRLLRKIIGLVQKQKAKTKWPPDISRSNMIFQQIKPGTSVIPHFYVIFTGQSISCIILKIQGHHQGQFQGQISKNTIFTN